MIKGNNLSTAIKPVTGLLPASRAAGDADGAVVDRRGHQAALVVLQCGSLGGGTASVELTHGDASDGSDQASFAVDAPVSSPTSADNDVVTVAVDLSNAKRYIRATATTAGGTTVVGVVIVLANYIKTFNETDQVNFDGFFQPN